MAELALLTLTRTPALYARLLSGLAGQVGAPDYTGVVVNNASSEDVVRSAVDAGRWAVLDAGYNTTFSEGNNLAAKVFPDAEWLLLLNDDLVLTAPDFLRRLWAMRDTPHDVLGAVLAHSDGTVNHAGADFAPFPHAHSRPLSDHMGRNDALADWVADTVATVPAVTFAAALIRRECWNSLGGLDTSYHYGWEDTDFCLRVMAAGGSAGVVRNAVAVHDECGTRARSGRDNADNFNVFRAQWPDDRLREMLAKYHEEYQGEGLAWLA